MAARARGPCRADRRFPAHRLGFSRDPGGARGDDRRSTPPRGTCLVPRQDRPPFAAFVRLRWIGEAINTTLPVAQIGGDLVRARLLQQRISAPARGAASVAVDFCDCPCRANPVHGPGLCSAGLAQRRGELAARRRQRGAAAPFRNVLLGIVGAATAARGFGARSPEARPAPHGGLGARRLARRWSLSQTAVPPWRSRWRCTC